ncbi:MAG: hypothetical protein RJA81_1431 [Planctomycetota bacterium]|jgi:hypothetical protein
MQSIVWRRNQNREFPAVLIMIMASGVVGFCGCGQSEQFQTMQKKNERVLNKRAEIVSHSVAAKRKQRLPSLKNPAQPVTAQRGSIR